jgi:hypothetical protein
MRHSMAIFKKKVTQASLLMATLLGAQNAQANDPKYIYQLEVDGKAKVPVWLVINNVYGTWSNVGGNYNCATWTPPEGTITWGDEFQQSRICNQNQERDVTPIMLNPVLKTTKQGEVYQDGKVINVTQYNPAIGTLDYVVGERAADWGTWIDAGGNYACDDWTPSTETVNLFENFTQNRDCSQNQTRSRQVFNVWASGDETPKRVDPDAQTITEEQLQVVQGTRDFIDGQSITAWSTWSNEETPYACGDWGATPTSQTTDYTQNRVCSQDQSRTRTINNIWKSGRSTFNSTETGNGTVDVTQLRTVTVSWSDWSERGRTFDCTEYDPQHGFQTENFTQERTCVQRKVRTRSYSSGESFTETGYDDIVRVRVFRVYEGDWVDTTISNVGSWSPVPSTQTVGFTQTRSYRQNRERVWDYATEYFKRTETGYTDESEDRAVTVSYSPWVESDAQFSCAAWSPTPTSQTASFTQTQDCSQGQVRSRIYSVGSTVISTVSDAGSRNVSVTNSRTVSVSVSGWSNVNNSNFGSWVAAASSQTSSFTQTRAYRTNRTRTWTYSDGNSRVETGYTNQSQSRTVSVGYSGWSNSGGEYSCGSWSPSSTYQTSNFTQTQSCSQDQVRNRVYTVGSTVIGTASNASSQTVSVSNSRTVNVSVGGWSNTSTYNFGSWTPNPTTQTSSYTQSRSYRQGRERIWTYSDGHSRYQPGYTNQSQGRTVSVSWSGWSNSGGTSNCSSWSPASSSQTSNFTQTRWCDQGRVRSRNYSTGHAFNEYVTIRAQDTRTVSVSAGSWSNTSATNYGSWSPAASTQTSNFTQSRSYRQNRQRTWSYSDGHSRVEPGYTNQSQSRTVSVSWSGWSNYQGVSNCSAWSPATNTRQQGVSFTQTRWCDQGRVRTRSYSSGQSASEYVTIRVSQAQGVFGTDIGVTGQSAGAWRNTGGIYSCSSYSPAASTVDWGQNYTATRTCSQNQYRDVVSTISYADGSSSQSTTRQTQVTRPTSTTSSVGTRNYIVRTETVYSHYTYSSNFSCGTWSPATSSINAGVGFTQSRSCTRYRYRYNDVYTVYASGYRPMTTSNVYAGRDTQTPSYSQYAVGTKQTLKWTYTGNQMQWAGDGMAAFYAYNSAKGAGRTSLPSGSCPTSGSSDWYIVSYAQEEANRTCVARGASGCVTRQYVCQ